MRINEIGTRGIFYNQADAIKALDMGERVFYVKGDLNLRGVQVVLPDNLKVSGTLSIDKDTLIPNNLKVGSLFIINSKIRSLPNDITISNSLDIHQTPLQSLPVGLTVPGNLKMSIVHLKELPSVNVGGNISITSSWLKKLPDNLKVNGDLDIEMNTISQLPNNLVVAGDFNLLGTWVERKDIPKSIRVNGSIKGL